MIIFWFLQQLCHWIVKFSVPVIELTKKNVNVSLISQLKSNPKLTKMANVSTDENLILNLNNQKNCNFFSRLLTKTINLISNQLISTIKLKIMLESTYENLTQSWRKRQQLTRRSDQNPNFKLQYLPKIQTWQLISNRMIKFNIHSTDCSNKKVKMNWIKASKLASKLMNIVTERLPRWPRID